MMGLSLNLGLAQRGGGAVRNPGTIVTSAVDFAWWEAAADHTGDGNAASRLTAQSGSIADFDLVAGGNGATWQTRDGIPCIRPNANTGTPVLTSETSPVWSGVNTFVIAGWNVDGEIHNILSRAAGTDTSRQTIRIMDGTAGDPNNSVRLQALGGTAPANGVGEVPPGPFVLRVTFKGPETVVQINHSDFAFLDKTTTQLNERIEGIKIWQNESFGSRGYDLAGLFACNGPITNEEIFGVVEYFMDKMGLPYTPYKSDVYYTPNVSQINLVQTIDSALSGYVNAPASYGSVVYVGDDTKFDNCEDASGRRLNYLAFTSTDHLAGGAYLTCIFGDPSTASDWSVERIDDAITNGRLANYNSGAGPGITAGDVVGGIVHDYRGSFESPWVARFGSIWGMTAHPFDPVGTSGAPSPGQRTVWSTASEPWGPWTVRTADPGTGTDVFLPGADLSDSYHTGYARWWPADANDALTGDYHIRSLYVGGSADTANAVWTADSNMENVTLRSTAETRIDGRSGITAPDGGLFQAGGASITQPIWDASTGTYVVFSFFGIPGASGTGLTYGGMGQARLNTSYQFVTDPSPGFVFDSTDMAVSETLSVIRSPVICPTPSGGHVLFVEGQGPLAEQEYLYAMPITIGSVPSAALTQATGGDDLDLSFSTNELIDTVDLTQNWTTNGNKLTLVSVSPALPSGLVVNKNGLLTGTAPGSAVADATYTLTMEDRLGRQTSDTFTLEVV